MSRTGLLERILVNFDRLYMTIFSPKNTSNRF